MAQDKQDKIERADLAELRAADAELRALQHQYTALQNAALVLPQQIAAAQAELAGLSAEIRKRYEIGPADRFDMRTGEVVRAPKSVPAEAVAGAGTDPRLVDAVPLAVVKEAKS